jgi:hypothetical protein
LFTTAAKIPPV